MAVKDVELFVQEKRKNEALKKEWEETSKQEATLKEDQKEAFFNEKLYPILKKYGFDFSFNDFCEYKGNSKSQDSDEELSDDELFNVAGGAITRWERDRYFQLANKRNNDIPLSDSEWKEMKDLRKRGWDVCRAISVMNI